MKSCVLAVAMLVPAIAAADQIIEFESASYSSWGAYVQGRADDRVKLKGILHVPEGDARVPAVVIMHGGSGITTSERAAAGTLKKSGIAAFLVDQVGGRSDGGPRIRISNMSHAADALNALGVLQGHPRIDVARVAVLGFSQGGVGTIATNSEALRAARLPPNLKFRAHVGVYPACVVTQHGATASTGAPMLLLVGGKDQSTPARACEDLAAIHKETGTNSNIQLVMYEGAEHAWDNPDVAPSRHVAQQGNGSACPMSSFNFQGEVLLRNGGPTRRVTGAEALSAFQNCVKTGASVGYSADAANASTSAWLAFLRQHLGI